MYRYPAAVTEACLLQAAVWWRERLGGPFRPPEGEGRGDARRHLSGGSRAAETVSPARGRAGGVSVTGYASAGRSYVAVEDADGVLRDLSPWMERVGPLGRELSGTRHGRRERRVGAHGGGAGGCAGVQPVGPVGRHAVGWSGCRAVWDRRTDGCRGVRARRQRDRPAAGCPGRFVCLSYRISSAAGESVRFEAKFRQDGPVELGTW